MTAISCDTIILGGGPVGLALANRALGMNLRVAVIEQQAQIGGLMQDSFLAGHRFDVGTFQFSPADSLFSQFPELLRDFVREVGRTYVRLPDDRFMPWPPTPNRIARSFNEKIKILTSLVTSKIRFRKRSDLAQFCRYYCGDYYFEQYGLKRYIENLFHLPIAEVDMEVAMDRLEFLSKFGVRAFLRRSLEKAPIKATKELCRPHYGFRTLFDRIAVSMRNRGACILTDCAAREINGGQSDGSCTRSAARWREVH